MTSAEKLMECATQVAALPLDNIHNTNDEGVRAECIAALTAMFTERPHPADITFELITLLLALPIYDRIYVQRAIKPLSIRLGKDSEVYREELARFVQSTDAWTDLNILNDKHRKALLDEGLSIEFKLP